VAVPAAPLTPVPVLAVAAPDGDEEPAQARRPNARAAAWALEVAESTEVAAVPLVPPFWRAVDSWESAVTWL
jgi:hypothetical protein